MHRIENGVMPTRAPMEHVWEVVTFLWPGGFHPIAIPSLEREELRLRSVDFEPGVNEACMVATFRHHPHANAHQVSKFIAGVAAGFHPCFCDVDNLALRLSFFLGTEGRCPADTPLDSKARLMVDQYLKLLQLCGIASQKPQIPRVVVDLIYGRSLHDTRAVPLGQHLIQQALLDLSCHHRS